MAHITEDRVADTSTTTGTGAFAVSGTAPTGYRTFSAVLATNDTCWYAIQHQTAAEWEVGLGTYSSANTITRTTVLASSNSGSAVSFSAGTKDVFITLAASKTVQQDNSGAVGIDANSSSAALRITQTGAGNAFVVEDSTNPDSTPFVIDTSGNTIIGNTTTTTVQNPASLLQMSSMLQVVGSSATAGSSFIRADASGNPQVTVFAKARGSISSPSAVSAGDTISRLSFQGHDGTNFIQAAFISAEVDTTPGTNDMPGRLVFSTTADGASTPTERMRIDNLGNIGVGTTGLAGYNLRIVKNLTGSTTSRSFLTQPTIQSDVTGTSISIQSLPTTAASAFTLSSMIHFLAEQGTLGAGSAVTNQYGYYSGQSLIGATANYAFIADNTAAVTTGKTAYGFYSTINTATGGGTTWQMYLAGTANSYIGGNVGIGTSSPSNKLTISGSSGSTVYQNITNGTQTFLLGISAGNVPLFGTTSNDPVLIYTNNAERMRISNNGSIGIGTTATAGYKINIGGSATGATSYDGVVNGQTIQSDVTSLYRGFLSVPGTQAAAFTLADLRHFAAQQNVFGAGSSVTNQYGVFISSSLTGATNNYGVYSAIASGTGRYNFYAAGTADNYFAGNVGIGTTTPGGALGVASAVVLGNQASTGTSGTIRMIASGGVAYIQVGQNTTTASAAPLVFGSLNGGSEWMRITSAGDVGIGTSSPAVLLHATSTTATTNAVTNVLRIDSQSSGTPANGIGVGMQFAVETAAGNTEIGATIQAVATDVTSTSEDFALTFSTMAAGATAAERMRIDSSGNVGIGGTPGTKLDVQGTGAVYTRIYSTDGGAANLQILSGSNAAQFDISGTAANFNNYASGGSFNIVQAGAGYMSFTTNSVERMRITSAGNVGIGTASFGTSAAGVLGIATGTAPTTGPADTIQIYSTDLSAGNTMLSLYTEGTPVNANTTAAATHRIAIRVNGTVYYLLANTAA